MRLQTKISTGFGVTILAAVLTVGGVAYQACYSLSMRDVSQSMVTSANLASQQISGVLDSYKRMTSVTGEDPTISDFTNNTDSSMKSERIAELAEEYGFTSGNILDANGMSIVDGTDFSDRDYYQSAIAGEVVISDITLSKYTNTYGFSVAAPVGGHESTAKLGVVYYRMDIDFMEEITNQITISDNSYAYIVDKDGRVIVHPNKDLINVYNLNEQGASQQTLAQALTTQTPGFMTYDSEDDSLFCGYAPIASSNGWSIVVAAPSSDFMDAINSQIKFLIILDVVAMLLAILVGALFAGSIGKKAKRVEKALVKISNGDFSEEVPKTKSKDELGILQNTASELQTTFKEIISETNGILGAMANCNLAVDNMNSYPGDFDKLAQSVNTIKEILGQLIKEVQESASSVGVGSGQLADAADALSRGTVAQASSIEQVVIDVQDVAERIQKNSDNEILVDDKLKKLEALIQEGNGEMTKLLNIVREVEEMSADIQKIVGTIDSIAFQTNILALNASVEAARAGENGKGFAVVADEVGSLAAKTSEASKQTSELIGRCIDGINNAMKSADTTFECLGEIVSNSGEISKAFEEISEATKEQAEKSTNIRQEMGNISDVVQTNTATAQQTAAATQELSEQAKSLSELIQKFQI